MNQPSKVQSPLDPAFGITFNTKTFNGIICFPDSGSINESESDATYINSIFNDITRGTMNITDNCFILVQ